MQEEGPIKEHLLGEAWQKRQLTRDGKAFNADEINFNLGNEDAPEEDAEYDHLDGEEVSAFNMKDEEAEGFNTLTGEIAPRRSEDDESAEDPWLLSLQQEEVRRSVDVLSMPHCPLAQQSYHLLAFREKRHRETTDSCVQKSGDLKSR